MKLTELGLLLLVSLAGLNALLSLLGFSDGLLDGDEPAITLSQGLSLEGVLVAVNLESEGNSSVLGKVGGVGLLLVNKGTGRKARGSVRTKFRTPAGLSFLSACLTKKRRPFPVWLDHAAVG